MIMFDKSLPTMFSYIATHSLVEMLRRFLTGLVVARGVEWVWPFLGIFVCIPKRWLTYFQVPPTKQLMVTVATTLVLTFYLAFAWSAVVQRGIRYLFPIFFIIFLLLADIIVFYAARLVYWLWPPLMSERLTMLSTYGLLVALSMVWLVQLCWRDFQAPL